MNGHRYDQFSNEELILRDQLAIDRTMLANDRTILAFGRTALTMIVTGATVLHFLDGKKWQTFGWFFAFGGMLVLVLGTMRYRRIQNQLAVMIKTMRQKQPHGIGSLEDPFEKTEQAT